MGFRAFGQEIIGGGNDISAKGIADQHDVPNLPFLAVGVDDARKVIGHFLRLFFFPEVTQGIDADHRYPLLLQRAADFLVQIAPAAVTGIDHRHGVHRRARFEDRDRQA